MHVKENIDLEPDHDIDTDAYGINRRHDEVCPNCYKPIFFGSVCKSCGMDSEYY